MKDWMQLGCGSKGEEHSQRQSSVRGSKSSIASSYSTNLGLGFLPKVALESTCWNFRAVLAEFGSVPSPL